MATTALSSLALLVGATVVASPTAADSGVLFDDDFSAGAGRWDTSGGAWSVTADGVYAQTDDNRNARAFAGNPDWQNVTVRADVTPLDVDGSSSFAAVLGRVQGTETYYYLTLRGNDSFEINKLESGSRTELASTSFAVENGRTYTLALGMRGDELVGHLDGQPLISATDDSFASGEAGLKTFNATGEFDNVVVTGQQDDEPPSAPTNLRVTGTTSSSVGLAWDAATDNDQVAAYRVFRSDQPDTPVGSTGADRTEFTVTGLDNGRTYAFHVVASDRAGNDSEPSATATATTDENPPDPPGTGEPIGYAALNGGTTGGFGAATVHEYVLSDYWPQSEYDSPADAMYGLLKQHRDASTDEGLVIYVDETVSASEFDGSKMDVKDLENASLLGVGEQGEFDSVGINIRNAHNVVVRNLEIHHVDTGEKDGIGVQADSSNVWIDHNEIHNEFQGVDKDHYDGLIDIKNGSEYITVSFNHLHDSWKTMLTAASDSEDAAGDYITYAHNRIENVNSRVPLVRRSDVHMLNNYIADVESSAINARMGARILVEGNFFENVGSGDPDGEHGNIQGPVGYWYGSDETGYWNLVDNEYVDSPHDHLESTTGFTVPYDHDALSPDQARDVAMSETGVGVVSPGP